LLAPNTVNDIFRIGFVSVVADGQITRIYAIRNPHKLARLDEEATLSR
jgi:hypothetical protein